MKTPVRGILGTVGSIAVAFLVAGCGQAPSSSRAVALVPAPPGPEELGPATGLAEAPEGAVVFDLKYSAQTGGPTDIPYRSYWGYGGSTDGEKTDPFLQEVRKKAAQFYFVQNPSFKGREWSAVEHKANQALALYFDLNADGKLDDHERISPTRDVGGGVDFITPDFINVQEDGSKALSRAQLQVSFYEGNSEPNCMWSPAALMEGTAKLEGKPARLILFANHPGGLFDKYGSCTYALLLGDSPTTADGQYFPRETLSSLVASEGKFYHLTVQGRRSNGLPARVMLVKDTSPVGTLSVKLSGSNSLQAKLNSLYLHGIDEETVYLHCSVDKQEMPLPVGTYALTRGVISYGTESEHDWELWFTEGPRGQIKDGESQALTLGQPALKVRAIDEKERYNSQANECATFKKGTRIYLEPKVVGKGQEVFTRFRQGSNASNNGRTDRPPKITITGPGGKQVLSSTMEYG